MIILRVCLSQLLFLCKKNLSLVYALMWPIAKRVLGIEYVEIVHIGNGIKMRIPASMMDMSAKILLFYSRKIPFSWEPVTTRLFLKLMPKKQHVVVAGANLGYYALIAANTNPAAAVVTFEPVSRYYQQTVDNVALNHFLQIQVEQLALSNTPGIVDMLIDNGQSAIVTTSTATATKKTETVKAVTLDGFLTTPIDLLLLDVEGYELYVLEGATHIIDAHHPDVIFEVGAKTLRAAGISIEQIIRFFTNHGYQLFLIQDDYNFTDVRLLHTNFPIRLTPFTKETFLQQPSTWMNVFATTTSTLVS